MQAANRLQKALRTGSGPTFGAWQMLAGSNVSRIIARSGFDWVVVDTEHGNIDDGAMHEAVTAIAGCGGHSMLEVHTFTSSVVPLLNTVDDAKSLVKSAKFPPAGQRGFGSPFAMEKFGGVTQTEYLQQANDSLLTIAQVETRDALQNVEEIAKVPGIDVLFCGPFDLGNNLGHPVLDGTMHDELKEAIAKIQRVAKENNKASGIYATSGDQARQYADQGFQMVSVATDATSLPAYLHSALTAAKGSYVHSALTMAKGALRSH
ncbi:MAG: hypothetical protein LQ343_002136 [Gyalolechia ehrenbergii]|nr:MAG: hypothetical protein LQ343_002136 [Gyalolechia ehrenbergii]